MLVWPAQLRNRTATQKGKSRAGRALLGGVLLVRRHEGQVPNRGALSSMGYLFCWDDLCGVSFPEFGTIGGTMDSKKLVFLVAAAGSIFMAFLGVIFEQYWLCASPFVLLLFFWAVK